MEKSSRRKFFRFGKKDKDKGSSKDGDPSSKGKKNKKDGNGDESVKNKEAEGSVNDTGSNVASDDSSVSRKSVDSKSLSSRHGKNGGNEKLQKGLAQVLDDLRFGSFRRSKVPADVENEAAKSLELDHHVGENLQVEEPVAGKAGDEVGESSVAMDRDFDANNKVDGTIIPVLNKLQQVNDNEEVSAVSMVQKNVAVEAGLETPLEVGSDDVSTIDQSSTANSPGEILQGNNVLLEGYMDVPKMIEENPTQDAPFKENSEVSSWLQRNSVSSEKDFTNEVNSRAGRVIMEGPDSVLPIESWSTGEIVEGSHMPNNLIHLDIFFDKLENIKKHLYLTNLGKDFLQLQLDEHDDANADFQRHAYDELSKLWAVVTETRESHKITNEELDLCRSELKAVLAAKGDLEIQLLSRNDEIVELRSKTLELQGKLESSQEQSACLLTELGVCKGSLENLQKENLSLVSQLASEEELKKKYEEEKELLISQHATLVTDLSEQKELLLVAHDKQNQLESMLRETESSFEQLTEENLYLNTSLVIYKVKIRDVEDELHKLKLNLQRTEQKQNDMIQQRIDDLVVSLSACTCNLDDLQKQFDEVRQGAHYEIGNLSSKVVELQDEMNFKLSAFREERENIMGDFQGAIDKLDKYTGFQVSDGFDIGKHAVVSVDAAIISFENMHEKLDNANAKIKSLDDSCLEVNKLLAGLQQLNELAVSQMQKMYATLGDLLPETSQNFDKLDPDMTTEQHFQFLSERCGMFIAHIKELLDDRSCILSQSNEQKNRLFDQLQQIEEQTKKCNALVRDLAILENEKVGLQSMLLNKNTNIEELNKICLALFQKMDYEVLNKNQDSLFVKSENDGAVLAGEDIESNSLKLSLLQLEKLVSFHIHNYNDAAEQTKLSKKYMMEFNIFPEISDDNWSLPLPTLLSKEFLPRVSELLNQLGMQFALNIKYESELQILMDIYTRMKEAVEESYSKLHLKASELEQSEQRLSSVKEKLSIAVAKGKGLVAHRDNLKQLLMEKSTELEKCSHELQSKEELLRKIGAELKSYKEDDRVQALESELSYIRYSATALRDSFIVKDTILQSIEEVLEKLNWPEYLVSKNVVEKIELMSEMLVNSASFTMDKNIPLGLSSDKVAVVMNDRNDDIQDISIEEKNRVGQKFEEVLDRINMPPQIRILEPVDMIEWVGNRLSEVHCERDALQLKIENLNISSDLHMIDLEESQKRVAELSTEIAALQSDKVLVTDSLDKLRSEYNRLSEEVIQGELERNNLKKEVACFQENLAAKVDEIHNAESEMLRLEELVGSVFYSSEGSEAVSIGNSTSGLEALLKKLIDEYNILIAEKKMLNDAEKEFVSARNDGTSDVRTLDVSDVKEQELIDLRLDLEKACSYLDSETEERNKAMDRCNSLMVEIENIQMQLKDSQEECNSEMKKKQMLLSELDLIQKEKDALQDQLNLEEQKSSSAKDKLNIAVKRGKALVQQRDSLKHEIEEMNSIMDKLKSENNQKVESLEYDNLSLIKQLTETEQNLEHAINSLSRLSYVLNNIDVDNEIKDFDPVHKLEQITKMMDSLRSAVVASEKEAKKSERAAELLLAELNEVQERVDFLQDELVKVQSAKDDALCHFEEYKLLHSEEMKKQLNELIELTSDIDYLKKIRFEFSNLLINAFSQNVNLFEYMESYMESIEKKEGCNISTCFPLCDLITEDSNGVISGTSDISAHEKSDDLSVPECIAFAANGVHECAIDCNDLKKKITKYSFSIKQHADHIMQIMDSIKKNFMPRKDHEDEYILMRQRLSLLYQACINAIAEIENFRCLSPEKAPGSRVHALEINEPNSDFSSQVDHQLPADVTALLFTDDLVRTVSNKLLVAVRNSQTNNTVEVQLNELKATVLKLHNEIQERDAKIDGLNADILAQIKIAEANENKFLSANSRIHSLELQNEVIEHDKELQELRVKELEILKNSTSELEGKVQSLTGTLTSKNQEIEDLLQAVDDKETEIEALESRKRVLEKMVQEKSVSLDNLEASHKKVLVKLSTTVNKFDELHYLSESLLAEVEDLQLQLQSRESEISFLRQEATRCSNDLLSVQQENKKYSSELHELAKWLVMLISKFGPDSSTDIEFSQINTYTEMLGRKVVSSIAELGDLHNKVDSKDALLQNERVRVEELLSKAEMLEASLTEKDNYIQLLEVSKNPRQFSRMDLPGPSASENKKIKSTGAAIASHVRNGRKVNDDQIAVDIGVEKDDHILDEDDDKAHGFKPLVMSCFFPRVTRPLTDRIDGIWVSGDRLLMRQSLLRFGLLVYWVVLHALLSSLI